MATPTKTTPAKKAPTARKGVPASTNGKAAPAKKATAKVTPPRSVRASRKADAIAEANLANLSASIEPETEALPVEIPEDRVERLLLAKKEHAALVEWRSNGQKGDRPATPVLDFYADPNAVVRKARKSTGTGSPRVVLDPAVEAKAVEFINARRRPAEGAPQSWTLVVKDLQSAGVEYPGGDWNRGRVRAIAKRLGMDVFGKEG